MAATTRRNDYESCTTERQASFPRAVTAATGLSYGVVQAAFRKYGRKDNSPTRTKTARRAIAELGFGRFIRCGGTVAQFIKQRPVGVYVVQGYGHAFAVWDGELRDWKGYERRLRRRIKGYWKRSEGKGRIF